MHGQTGAGCGRGDQLNDGLVADQRFGTPVLANEREQAVLNLVPLAGAGWEVTTLFRRLCCEKEAPSGQLEIKTAVSVPCPSWATG